MKERVKGWALRREGQPGGEKGAQGQGQGRRPKGRRAGKPATVDGRKCAVAKRFESVVAKGRPLEEAGAEIVEIIFGLVVGIALVSGFIALEGGLNTMGGEALKIMDNRYAALAVSDMGLEKSEPGGIDPGDDGESEVIPGDPDDPGSGGEGGGGSGGSGGGTDPEPGELPDVEEEGGEGETSVDTDL